MKVTPEKPHFFKPMLAGFEDGIMIPKSFFKYLNGQKCEHAVLRRGCKEWPVRINGRRFEDGWRKFAEDHDLDVGDFLVFRHEGDMVFEVLVFDPSACEIEYPPCDVTHVDPMEAKENPVEKSEEKSKINGCEKIQKNKQVMMHPDAKATSSLVHPFFHSTVKPHNLKDSIMYIPIDFARSNSLINRCCEMIIRDQTQKSWTVQLRHKGSTHVYIGRGWDALCNANGLEEGDAFMFELIENGKKPILNFHALNHKPASSTFGDPPSFVSTVKPYSIQMSVLYLPMKFARENGLSNRHCEMILRDQKQRSWPVELEHRHQHVCIGRGWRDFHIENGLKEGDAFKFELIENGKKPIVNFHCNFSEGTD